MRFTDRTENEKNVAQKYAQAYLDKPGLIKRTLEWLIDYSLPISMVVILSIGAMFYGADVLIGGDNERRLTEAGQQPVIDQDRTIETYEWMKGRYGLK